MTTPPGGSGAEEFGELTTPDNTELLRMLDSLLLELERRLYMYAKKGTELIHMADEGLILASRSKARLGQAISAAEHAEGHLQVVGVGDWNPRTTKPGWGDDPRVGEANS